MPKPLALLFAVAGVLLLLAISISISFHKPWLVLLFIILSLGVIGFGFVTKARLRRKHGG